MSRNGQAAKWARRFLDDVSERQVNTIIATDGILGRTMGHELSGLVQITNSYFRALKAGGFDVLPPDKIVENKQKSKQDEDYETLLVDAFDKNSAMKGNSAAFGVLETLAAHALDEASVGNPNRIVYQRIASMSSQLKSIVRPFEDEVDDAMWSGARSRNVVLPILEFEPEQRAVIVKAWELGTSKVAIQTTISLDGDLVTRIAPEYLDKSGEVVRSIHSEAVRISINTWESLLKGIMQLTTAAFR